MCVCFGHLTGRAALDVFCDEGFHVRPPVVRGDKLEHFGNTSEARTKGPRMSSIKEGDGIR